MATKQPTRRELKKMVDTLGDLIHYSKAHIRNTTKTPEQIRPTPGIWGTDLFTWEDLNAAIGRAEKLVEERNEAKKEK